MSELPPIPYASGPPVSSIDEGHLKTIAICHYVWGGLVMLLSCLFNFHIFMGLAITHGRFPNSSGQNQMPPQMGYFFIFFGSVALLIGWTVGILTIISGRRIAQRRWRMFSLVMAGVNCASFPFGTLLGIFTFIVLLRDSVRGAYPA